MKYTIVTNQVGIARDKELLENTDLIDWAIIDYLFDWREVSGALVFTDNAGRRFVWCSYDHLLAQMPLLKLSKSALSRRLAKMRGLGLIITRNIDKRVFVYITPRAVGVRFHMEHPSETQEGQDIAEEPGDRNDGADSDNKKDAESSENAGSLHQRNNVVAPAQRSSKSMTRESKNMHTNVDSATVGDSVMKKDSIYMPDLQKNEDRARAPKRGRVKKSKGSAYTTRPLVNIGSASVKITKGNAHFMALAEVCKIDVRGATVNQKKQLGQSSKILRENLEATPEQIRNFARWWYENDWRGRRGQAPEPKDVREQWGRYFSDTAGGKARGVIRLHR